MRALALLVVAGAALVGAGCAGGDDDEPAAQPNRPAQAQGRVPPKLVDKTVVRGGSSEERALLGDVVDGMEKTTLQRIAIRQSGGGEGGDVVAIEFTPVKGETTRRQWDEWIVAGAFSRRLLAEGSPAQVDGADARGTFRARPRLSGKPDPRPLSAKREAAVVKAVRNAVRRSGADLVSLEMHRPHGAAIALTLSTDEPARYLRRELRPLLQRLDRHRPQLEGLYLAVLEDRRRIVLEWGSWTRNPAGSYWVRRDLADCSPIRQSEPTGAKPPPKCSIQ